MDFTELIRIIRDKNVGKDIPESRILDNIMESGYDIVHYCNMNSIEDIPSCLYYTWARIANAYLRDDINDSDNFINGQPGPIAEIKELDVSIKYAVKSVNSSYSNRHSPFNHILNTYKPLLQEYRRLV